MKNHIVFVAVFLWLVSAFAATAPAAWKFVATGDSRGDDHGVNTEILGEIANEIVAAGGVELVVVPGDLITSGGTNQFQTWRDTMAPVYNAGIEVYPIRGNHDDDNDAAWITKFGADIPDNGPSGAVNYTYYVEHNNALFIGFDNYIGSYGRIPDSWLTDLLDNNTKPHIFTFAHQPAFKVDHSDCLDDNPTERNAFVADFLEAGGRVYFCGHDHFLDILRADDGDGDPDDDFIQYLVGTAGAPLRDTEPYNGSNSPYTPINIVHSKSYGYTIVEINGNTVTMTYMKRISANNYQSFHVMSYSVGYDIDFNGQTTIELEKHEACQIQVDVYSTIDQTLNWTITGQSGYSWITNLTPSAGTSTGQDDKTTVTIDIDAAGLAPGDYTCELLLEADNGDTNIIPVALTVYDRADIEEFACLAQYWMDDCGDVDECFAFDWYVDGTIDTLDLQQLALSWLGECIHISHWKFDEQTGTFAEDSIGYHDGTLTSFPTDNSQWVEGKVGNALSFDGIDDYVDVGNDSSLDMTNGFTVSAWVKTDGFGPTQIILAKDHPGQRAYVLYFHYSNTAVNFQVFDTDITYTVLVGNSSLSADQWYHVVGTYEYVSDESSVLKVYVNGVLDNSTSTAVGPVQSTSSNVNIGRRSYPGHESPFDGSIDEVRIYDEALSQDEILWLYTNNQ